MPRKVELTLDYMPYFELPREDRGRLWGQACSNDATTVNHWRQTWIDQYKANHAKYGPFKDRSIGRFFRKHFCKPAIIAGSGPSLKVNAHLLKDRPDEFLLISCLHNFHFFEDLGVKVDAYVSLDAGPVTIEEVYEGGSKKPDEYWAMTKGKTLLAFAGSHPDLLAKWQGEIYFFSCPVPDKAIIDEWDKLERFNMFVGTGGNVLGACMYIAKAVYGANPIVFIGADFSFGYDSHFHSWDSKYDANMGHTLTVPTVHGVMVKTWQSYYNFKAYFDHIAIHVPGTYINATEGGCLGAYQAGNIWQIRQMDLADVLRQYTMNAAVETACKDSGSEQRIILY